MNVRELILILQKYSPDAEVIIHRDCQNYGYGFIDKITTGVFEVTDYGNDFFPDQKLVVGPTQGPAICIYPDDSEGTVPIPRIEKH